MIDEKSDARKWWESVKHQKALNTGIEGMLHLVALIDTLETSVHDAMEQSKVSQKVLLIEQQKHIDTANWALEQQNRAEFSEKREVVLGANLKNANITIDAIALKLGCQPKQVYKRVMKLYEPFKAILDFYAADEVPDPRVKP